MDIRMEEETEAVSQAGDGMAEADLAAQVAQLTRERDEARQALTAQEAAARRAAAERAVAEGLTGLGARREVLPLLMKAVDLEGVSLGADGALSDPAALLPLTRRYPSLFSRNTLQPPAAGGGGLTREDIRRMTPEEINAHWPAVAEALKGM